METSKKIFLLLSYLLMFIPMYSILQETQVFSVIAFLGYIAYALSFYWDSQNICRYALFATIFGISANVYTTGETMLFIPLMVLPFIIMTVDDEMDYNIFKGLVIVNIICAIGCMILGMNDEFKPIIVAPYLATVVMSVFMLVYIKNNMDVYKSTVFLSKENREMKQQIKHLENQLIEKQDSDDSDANYLALILGLNFDGFEINEYVEQIMTTVKTTTNAIFAGYYTFDKMDKRFKLSSSFGESSLLQKKPIAAGFGSVGTTYETKQYTLIEDIQNRDMDDYEKQQTNGVDNLVAIPFAIKGEVIASVLIGLPKMPEKKVRSMIDLLTIMADKVNVELEKMESHKKIEKTSITDKLTGLYNRTYFDEKLETLFQNAKNEGTYLTYVLLDLDYFKQMNDTHGHDFGDKVLQTVAQTFRECMRTSDYAFRTGGDEFSLLLLGSDKKSAYKIVKRIANTYAQHVEDLHLYAKKDGMDVKSSFSIGVSSYPNANVRTPKELVKRADDAVYYVKEHGKNNIALAK